MKRIVFFLMGCLFLLALMVPSQAAKRGLGKTVVVATPFVNGVYRALLIGNNEYKDPEGLWVPLTTPIKDAEAIASALQTHYGFNPDHITFLKNATRAEILSSFSKLAKVTGENDSVFIYYAGHGYANPDTKEAFWIPIDAEGKEDYTYVRNSTLKSKLAVIADRAKHVFLVSDSCFSATLIREGHRGIKQEEKTEHYYRKVARKKSVQILAAGGLEYVDDNYKETGHSPFTHFFLKQLEHNSESYYSATELSLEVTKAVSANVYQTPEKGVLHGAGDNNGEFFFLRSRQLAEPEAAPAKQAAQPTKSETFDEEAEMWALVKNSNNIEDIKSFLATFPEGRLTPVARLKLAQLERTQNRGVSTTSDPEDKKRQEEKAAMAAEMKKMQDELKKLKTEQEKEKRLAYASQQGSRPSAPAEGLKSAIFPIRFEGTSNTNITHYLLKFFEKPFGSGRVFEEVYSYYREEDGDIFKKLPPGIDTEKVWYKKSFFSKPELKIDVVCEMGKKIGVDAVYIIHRLGTEDTVFHLIDTGTGKKYTSSGPGGVRKITRAFLKDRQQ